VFDNLHYAIKIERIRSRFLEFAGSETLLEVIAVQFLSRQILYFFIKLFSTTHDNIVYNIKVECIFRNSNLHTKE